MRSGVEDIIARLDRLIARATGIIRMQPATVARIVERLAGIINNNPVRDEELYRLAARGWVGVSATYRLRPIGSYYSSLEIPHGYTHEGRVIGAAIGPGVTAQRFASASSTATPRSRSIAIVISMWGSEGIGLPS